MGMFNYLRCDLPLPEHGVGLWQTKDVGHLCLDYYRINADGQLLIEENGIGVEPGTHLRDYTGVIHFYALNAKMEWLEYRAEVLRGNCVEIRRIGRDVYQEKTSLTPPPNGM